MAVYEGVMHVYWLSSAPAVTAAPTTTEITAGDDITEYVTKDGVNPGVTNNRVAKGSLADVFDGEVQGSFGASLSLTMFKERAGETAAWDLFNERGVEGCLVITPDGEATATEAAYVFPGCESGQPILPQSASNEEQKFTVEFAVELAPDFNATVTAPG